MYTNLHSKFVGSGASYENGGLDSKELSTDLSEPKKASSIMLIKSPSSVGSLLTKTLSSGSGIAGVWVACVEPLLESAEKGTFDWGSTERVISSSAESVVTLETFKFNKLVSLFKFDKFVLFCETEGLLFTFAISSNSF